MLDGSTPLNNQRIAPSSSATEGLAATGSDVSSTLLLGLLMAIGGMGLVLIGRRRYLARHR
ncbi:MAG: LPXTG cell wall anchor domain-containing protein [Jatrophihabitantaceae bacterium]